MALSVKNMLGGSGGGASPFAWGKYDTDVRYGAVIKVASYSSYTDTFQYTKLILASDDVDISTLTASDFVGVTFDFTYSSYAYKCIIDSETMCHFVTSSAQEQNPFVFDAEEKSLLLRGQAVSSGYTWDDVTLSHIAIPTVGNFLEYVTDKNPLKYPNGEIADDGFFYRYANEGLHVWNKNSIVNEFVAKWKTLLIDSTAWGTRYPRNIFYYKGEIHIVNSTNASAYTNHYKWNGNEWVYVADHPNYSCNHACDGNYIYAIAGGSGISYLFRFDGTTWEDTGCGCPTNNDVGTLVVHNNELHYLTGTGHYKLNGTTWENITSTTGYVTGYSNSSITTSACSFNGYIYYITSNYRHLYRWREGETWNRWNTNVVPYSGSYASLLSCGDKVYGLFNNATYRLYETKDFTTWTELSTDTSFVSGTPYGLAYDGSCIYCNFGQYNKTIAQFGYYEDHYYAFDKIISDNENAYPDKDVQDGYYYERSKSGIPLDYFGCTEFELYEFTRTSDTQLNSIKIPCTFGFPKFVSVYAENVPTSPRTYSIYYLTSWNKDGTSNVNAFIGYVNYGSTSYNGNLSTFYYTDGVIFSDTNYFFQSGVNYKVVFGK